MIALTLLVAAMEFGRGFVPASAAETDERLPAGAASCGECHSKAGGGNPPALDDLTPQEIATSLAAFRTGLRTGTMMPRIAPGFTPQESEAIAAALGRRDGPR